MGGYATHGRGGGGTEGEELELLDGWMTDWLTHTINRPSRRCRARLIGNLRGRTGLLPANRVVFQADPPTVAVAVAAGASTSNRDDDGRAKEESSGQAKEESREETVGEENPFEVHQLPASPTTAVFGNATFGGDRDRSADGDRDGGDNGDDHTVTAPTLLATIPNPSPSPSLLPRTQSQEMRWLRDSLLPTTSTTLVDSSPVSSPAYLTVADSTTTANTAITTNTNTNTTAKPPSSPLMMKLSLSQHVSPGGGWSRERVVCVCDTLFIVVVHALVASPTPTPTMAT